MPQNPRPPSYVNWPRLRLLVIGFISVLYGVLHFVAHETVGTPNVAWSAFIGLLAGLGIGIPILIKQRRIAQDGTDQHLGDPAVRSSASWIGLGVGLVLALVSGLYPVSGWTQLTPPPEPIVRLVENRLAYDASEGAGALGETAQGARYRYVCERRVCAWEVVNQSLIAVGAEENRCEGTAALPTAGLLPFSGLLPFAPQPVVSGYSGEACKDNRGARFALVATHGGRVWLWRSAGGLTEDGWQPLLFGLDVINAFLAGLFAGLFLFGLKGSRMLPVDRWTFLVHPSESLGLSSWRVIWRHPFTRLMRLATIVFGGPAIVLLLLSAIGVGPEHWIAELLKSILIAVLYGGAIAMPAFCFMRIAAVARPGTESVRLDLVAICALLGLWAGVLAAFATSEIPSTGWRKLGSSPAPFVRLAFVPAFADVPMKVCGVTQEGIRYDGTCKDDVCSWVQRDAQAPAQGVAVRCWDESYGFQRRTILPLPPGPVVLEGSHGLSFGESSLTTFYVILEDGSVWWWQRGSSAFALFSGGICVVWGLITGVVVGIAAARMRREGVDNVGNVVNVDNVGKVDNVDNVTHLTKPDPPDQTLPT